MLNMLKFMACAHRVIFRNKLELDGPTVVHSKKNEMIKHFSLQRTDDFIFNHLFYKHLNIKYAQLLTHSLHDLELDT